MGLAWLGGGPSKMSALRADRRGHGVPACVAAERETEATFSSTAWLLCPLPGGQVRGAQGCFPNCSSLSGQSRSKSWTQTQVHPGHVRSEPEMWRGHQGW